jgi:hypothetical protein
MSVSERASVKPSLEDSSSCLDKNQSEVIHYCFRKALRNCLAGAVYSKLIAVRSTSTIELTSFQVEMTFAELFPVLCLYDRLPFSV